MRTFITLLLGWVAVVTSQAQVNQTIYADALQNGWVSYGWATLNYDNAAPVHSGQKSISVTSTASYQAMYLHHDAFDTSLYTNLTFWINGGAKGGQKLALSALRLGKAQAAINLPILAANNWVQLTFTLNQLGVANRSDFDGFWIQDISGASGPVFYVDDITLTAVPPPKQVNISVNAAQILRELDYGMLGINTAVWDAAFNSTTTRDLLKEMDVRFLRFPGGSLSDEYHWQSNTTLANTWKWATSFDSFLNVATNTAARTMITVNYGTGTSKEASNWVYSANITRKLAVKYWEIGNENYGTWETDANVNPHDPYTYAVRAKDYLLAMRTTDPTIKIGVVVELGEDNYANGYSAHPAVNPRTGASHNGWTPVLLATLKQGGVLPDFVIYHKYAQNPANEADALLLQSSSSWAGNAADLRQQLTDYLGAAGAGIELFCTENNSVSSGPGKQTTSLVNALFMADSFGQAVQTEFKSLVWWDLRNGKDTNYNNSPSLYGWREYGDYGVLSGTNEKYPPFFAAKLLKYFGRDHDKIVKATSDYPLLATYASLRTNGSLSVLVVNKSPSNEFTAQLSLAGYQPSPQLLAYGYGQAQDNPMLAGPQAPDISQTPLTNGAPVSTHTFAPYSITVLSFAPPAPVISASLSKPNAGRLSISSPINQALRLESSSDLTNWTPVTSFVLTNGTAEVRDVSPTNVSKFYRTTWSR